MKQNHLSLCGIDAKHSVVLPETAGSVRFHSDNGNASCKISREPVPKIRILSDSHGRSLAALLLNMSPVKLDVEGFVKPNGTFCNVISGLETVVSDLNMNDTLVVFAGTNDIEDNSNNILNEINKLVELAANTKLVVIGLPYRRDRPFLNKKIYKINTQIVGILSNVEHSQFMSLDQLFKSHFYTRFGLHFNLSGKKRITRILYKLITSTNGNIQDLNISLPCHVKTISFNSTGSLSDTVGVNGGRLIRSKVFTNKEYFLSITRSIGRGP